LIIQLQNEKYFGTKEQGKRYDDKIYKFVENINSQKRYNCINIKFGAPYCKLKMNKRTTYYTTFDQEKNLFLVKNVFTNHESEYVKYIK
jgi:hypothetical protein